MRERKRTGRVTARTARRAALGGALAAGVIGLGAGPAGATFAANGTDPTGTPRPHWEPLPPSTLVTVTPGTSTGGGSIDANEIDWYSFVAPHTGIFIISTATPTSELDTVLGLYNQAGDLVDSSDDIDGSANRDSSITVVLEKDASYQFGVSNYGTSTFGAYNWTVQTATSK